MQSCPSPLWDHSLSQGEAAQVTPNLWHSAEGKKTEPRTIQTFSLVSPGKTDLVCHRFLNDKTLAWTWELGKVKPRSPQDSKLGYGDAHVPQCTDLYCQWESGEPGKSPGLFLHK